jgi:flagellar hook-associated protein 2
MAGITSAGVGSGLDLEAIIAATVDAENTPKLARFEKQESAVNLQLTALGQIKADLSSFEDQVDILKDIDNFNKRISTVTQPSEANGGDSISVTSESTATAGTFEVEVQKMAKGSRMEAKDANAYSATTDVVTATGGTLTFTAGSKTFDITLSAGATLEDLRTAINGASDNFGVSANIINTGGATPLSKLVYTSDETGTGNDLTVSNTTAELDNVSTQAFGGLPGSGGMETKVSAQDAEITIDGIAVSSATNTFKDAIQDSTITVLREDTVDPTKTKATLTVATDQQFVKDTMKSFVDSFNALVTTLDTVVSSRSADATARGLRNTLINQMGTFVTGAGNLQTIYDIGIGLNKEGKLEIDSTAVNTLDEALTNSYDDVGTLFAGAGGIGETLAATTELYLQAGGIIKDQTTALEQQKDDIEDDRTTHAYRMELFEKRLREKYANLDVLIAGMRSQGSAITSSLANLPGFTRES